MRSERHESQGETRITADEVEELRRRLSQESGRSQGLRASNATTISDVAEAFGLAVDDVSRHLERLRAELAVSGEHAKPRRQFGLLILAIVLFASAAIIYRITPHRRTEAEMESLLAEHRAAMTHRPRRVHYPITTTVDLGEFAPPPGFSFQMVGIYTVTYAKHSTSNNFLRRGTGAAQLAATFEALFERAEELERDAPRPASPLPKKDGIGPQPTDNEMVFISNDPTSSGDGLIQVAPAPGQSPEAFQEARRELCRRMGENTVKSILEDQQKWLDASAKRDPMALLDPPLGFGIRIKGRHEHGLVHRALGVLPVDEEAVTRRLEAALRIVIDADGRPPEGLLPDARAADRKIPTPPWTIVNIEGPLRQVTFKVPTSPSPEHPTAADVLRAFDQAIRVGVADAARQIRELNMGTHR